MSAAVEMQPPREPIAPRDRKDLEDIARLARWVGALEVDDEFTFTAEQLQRIARLIIARAGRIAA